MKSFWKNATHSWDNKNEKFVVSLMLKMFMNEFDVAVFVILIFFNWNFTHLGLCITQRMCAIPLP